MMNKKSVAVIAIVLFVLIGCFFLPSTVAGIMDKQTLGKLIMTDSSSISYEAAPDLALTARLKLISSSSSESAALKNGKNMDRAAALRKVITELKRFDLAGEMGFIFDNCAAEEVQVGFVINTEDPSVNMIIWAFQLRDIDGRQIMVIIDDETGVILQMIYRHGDAPPKLHPDGIIDVADMEKTANLLADMMTDYYGCPVNIKEYEQTGNLGYYNAEILSDGVLIPLYGIVRESGFTINE